MDNESGKKLADSVEPRWKKQRPRDRMWEYAIERIVSLELLIEISHGQTYEGWHRELTVMQDLKALIEWLDRQELERKAAADKDKGRRR